MIPTVGDYLYRVHHNRDEMLTRAERRKAWIMACGILVCIAIVILLWR